MHKYIKDYNKRLGLSLLKGFGFVLSVIISSCGDGVTRSDFEALKSKLRQFEDDHEKQNSVPPGPGVTKEELENKVKELNEKIAQCVNKDELNVSKDNKSGTNDLDLDKLAKEVREKYSLDDVLATRGWNLESKDLTAAQKMFGEFSNKYSITSKIDGFELKIGKNVVCDKGDHLSLVLHVITCILTYGGKIEMLSVFNAGSDDKKVKFGEMEFDLSADFSSIFSKLRKILDSLGGVEKYIGKKAFEGGKLFGQDMEGIGGGIDIAMKGFVNLFGSGHVSKKDNKNISITLEKEKVSLKVVAD